MDLGRTFETEFPGLVVSMECAMYIFSENMAHTCNPYANHIFWSKPDICGNSVLLPCWMTSDPGNLRHTVKTHKRDTAKASRHGRKDWEGIFLYRTFC